MSEKVHKEEGCKIAWEVAMNHIIKKCGYEGEKGRKEAFMTMGPMLGLTEKESNDISEKCKLILEEKLTKDRCFDFRGVRQWVMCRTWEMMEKERVPFAEGIRRAWDEIKSKCSEVGANI